MRKVIMAALLAVALAGSTSAEPERASPRLPEDADRILLLESFDRSNAEQLGGDWKETTAGAADLKLDRGRLMFAVTADMKFSPIASARFRPFPSGTLVWYFRMSWKRTGNEGKYQIGMQLGNSAAMDTQNPASGAAVDLLWGNLGAHETLGYRSTDSIAPLGVYSGETAVKVVANLDKRLYDIWVGDALLKADIPMQGAGPIDTVRFYADAINQNMFAGRWFDDIVILSGDWDAPAGIAFADTVDFTKATIAPTAAPAPAAVPTATSATYYMPVTPTVPERTIRPLVLDTIFPPFADTIHRDTDAGLADAKTAPLGVIDVTKGPFFADPSGTRDSTAAIQRAVDEGIRRQMLTYFPPGTYLVSDTIRAVQAMYTRSNGKVSSSKFTAAVLMGSTADPSRRAVIKLAPNAKGFSDPSQPKYVIHFLAMDSPEGIREQANISFNQQILSLDIVIGEGNAGAIALRHRAAQGSAAIDISIDATHGYKGLEGGAGSGGAHHGITVIGGKIGVDVTQTQPGPTISAFTLIGQTERPLVYAGRQSLCAVGIKIVTDTAPVAIEAFRPGTNPNEGIVTLIDASIEFKNVPNAEVIRSSVPWYARNVYVKGARTFASAQMPADSWARIDEAAVGGGVVAYSGYDYSHPIYIGGQRSERLEPRPVVVAAPPQDIVSRHLPAEQVHWDHPAAVSVKDPRYGARGDGKTDDTEAIRKAIRENKTVFLPKGTYRVTDTIELKPDTRLVGIATAFSIIGATDAGKTFTDHSAPTPILASADSKSGTAVLASLTIYAPSEVPGAYQLLWRTGAASMVRSVHCATMPGVGYAQPSPEHEDRLRFVVISGNGGGKWWNWSAEHGETAKDYRHLLIDGTSEPLVFYHASPEGARSYANCEIRGSRNVTVYGSKAEGNTTVFFLNGSENIAIFGYGGNAAGTPNSPLFRVEKSRSITLSGLVDHPALPGTSQIRGAEGQDPKKWRMVEQTRGDGTQIRTEPGERPILFKTE